MEHDPTTRDAAQAAQHTVEWLEGQRATWEQSARDQAATIVELQAHAQRQHDSIVWLEEQRAGWEKAARTSDALVAELQAQVRRLEAFVERMTSTGPQRG